ncbi:WD40-repeat-containing domain protein [Globomyces pollinis-pini]|nr:WD40-repeat-containing domain protein [Globomyces pollinis-pini]
MKIDYKFSNLCGTVYKRGNLIFTPDGNSLLSPVGNRCSVYDLISNKSYTLPFENRKDIARLALSPKATLLITVDVDGRALLIHFQKKVLLHHHNFKSPVFDIKFSPDGRFIAVTHENQIQVWHAPGFTREFAPFIMYKTYTGHYDAVTSITWSNDSKYFLSTSKDMTTRLHAIDRTVFSGACLTGHHDVVIGAWFSHDGKFVYTVSRDGSLFEWILKGGEWSEEDADASQMPRKKVKAESDVAPIMKWKSSTRHYFNQPNSKVVSATFHPKSGLLSIGFNTGIFGIWELPDFANIQTLSISQQKVDTVAINPSGEWLAFGCSKLGQLLVWEWQSESYVLKQQGHQHDMKCLDYSQDGQYIATGGDDGKVKLWSTQSGFCFVTFTEHTGSIQAIQFARKKQVVFTASLDGTVRAFDLIRYRNFRTFTSPTPQQFNSLAIDQSGEILCASSVDTFEIYVWSVQTGKLLDILAGHEGPVSCMTFSPASGQLASGSWDKTIRTWDIFSRDKASENIELTSEVLYIDYSPNGEILASTTMNGNINFWNTDTMKETVTIEGRKDIGKGRSSHDKTTKSNAGADKNFSSFCFTSDGRGVLAGGNSKFVCLYDIASQSLLKRFQISKNLSLDRMQDMLNSKNMTEFGPKDWIDENGELSDLEDRIDRTLPGVQAGDASLRSTKLEARSHSVKFSPTGRSWAAATTQGLLIYSVDDTIHFDPFDLDMDVNPKAVLSFLTHREYSKSLLCAFRLGEQPLIKRVYHSIPKDHISLVLRDVGSKYFQKLLKLLIVEFEKNPRLEFHLEWTTQFMKLNSHYLRDNSQEYRPTLRALHKCMANIYDDMSSL